MEKGDLNCMETGVNAFLVRYGRPIFYRWGVHLRRQARLERVRISTGPRPSGITWTKYKGTIGLSWKTNKNVAVNLASHRYSQLTQRRFDRLADADKLHLTFEEFQTASRHGYVIVAPIRDEAGKYRGCVTLDGPRGEFTRAMKTRPFPILGDAAETIWRFARG